MNRTLIFFVAVTIAASSACTMSSESPFFKHFSMRDLVTSNKSVKGFQCNPAGGGGGGGSIGSWSGGFGSGGTHFDSHKDDSFGCRLQSGVLPSADEEHLIASLKKQVEDSLRTYGANIKESGSRDSASFYFSYDIKDIHGRIQVSGKRIGVDYYNLQASLEERK